MKKANLSNLNMDEFGILANILIACSWNLLHVEEVFYPFGGIIEKDGSPGYFGQFNPAIIWPPSTPSGVGNRSVPETLRGLISAIINYKSERSYPLLAGICFLIEDFGFKDSNDDCIIIKLEDSSGDFREIRWRQKERRPSFPSARDLTMEADGDRWIFCKNGDVKEPPIPKSKQALMICPTDKMMATEEVPGRRSSSGFCIEMGDYIVCLPTYTICQVQQLPQHTLKYLREEANKLSANDKISVNDSVEVIEPGNVYYK